MNTSGALRLLADENVPDSVSRYLRDNGHRVELARLLFGVATPDEIVSRLSDREGLTILTWNVKHFAARLPTNVSGRAGYRHLGRILMRCSEVRAIDRLHVCLPSIVFEYEVASNLPRFEFQVEVGDRYFKVLK